MYLITVNGKPTVKTGDLKDALQECRERPGSVLFDCKSGAILARNDANNAVFRVKRSVIMRTCGKRVALSLQ